MADRTQGAEMSPEELAGRLGITRSQVYDRLKAGIIPHQKVGRRYVILRAEVERWLDQGPIPAPEVGEPEIRRLLSGGSLTFEVTIRLKR